MSHTEMIAKLVVNTLMAEIAYLLEVLPADVECSAVERARLETVCINMIDQTKALYHKKEI